MLVAPVRALLQRVKVHERSTWDRLDALVGGRGRLPSDVMADVLGDPAPALAALHLGVLSSTSKGQAVLPRAPAQPAAADLQVGNTCSCLPLGEIFWLFDAAVPYPVEIFWGGVIPPDRLPHCTRRQGEGHIARILGSRCNFIKVVPAASRMVPFTAECAPGLLITIESSVLCSVPRTPQECIHAPTFSSASKAHVVSHDCRTATVEALSECSAYYLKSRTRKKHSCVAQTEEGAAAVQEAAALVYLSTGEEIGQCSESSTYVRAVKTMLIGDKDGTSPCGECSQCSDGGHCYRVQNRHLGSRKTAAQWAEAGELLAGRRFQVCRLHDFNWHFQHIV